MTQLELIARQAQGKARRLVLTNVMRNETKNRVASRQGECKRCGECCKILFRCPFLTTDAEGQYTCRIYEKRFNSCRFFPVQSEDLMEVPGCGYSFVSDSSSAASRSARSVT
jgi:hypothetical protein